MKTKRVVCLVGFLLLFVMSGPIKYQSDRRSSFNLDHRSQINFSELTTLISSITNITTPKGPGMPTFDVDGNARTGRWDKVMKELRGHNSWNTSCHQLFPGADVKKYLPDEYWNLRRTVENKFKHLMENLVGNSGSFNEEMMAFWLVAKQRFVKTICEIGFNAGHSAMIWLANPKANVISFDLGHRKYTREIGAYMKKRYPRFQLYFGNSLKTVPDFGGKQHGACDIIIIDGSHEYRVVRKDVINMKALSHPGTLLGLDDTFYGKSGEYSQYGNQVMAAWHSISASGIATPLFHCQGASYSLNTTGPARGFLFARYN